jgi:pimeloyl-ACP methyl ester carboxylesterase
VDTGNSTEAWFAGGQRVEIVLAGRSFRVFSRISGSGPWLTLLHGFPTSSWDWAKVVAALEARHRVLAFDFLGFGDSDKPRRHRYTILEQADLTEALWSRFGVDETDLVGHDYGATVAQELVARAVEGGLRARLRGVVLLNAAVYARLARPLAIQRALTLPVLGAIVARAVSERRFARSLASVFSVQHQPSSDELHEHWRVLWRRRGTPPIAHRLSRYMADRTKHALRWEAALDQSTVPIGFVWGMTDPRSGAHLAEEIARRLPGVHFARLEGVGHYPQLEVPHLVADEIEKALGSMRPKSPRPS